MATSPEIADITDPRRPIDRWLFSYSGDHVNPTNQLIHVICVPAILWSVTAALWIIPVPAAIAQPGAWMAVAMFLSWAYYWRLSRPLAMGMLLVFVALGFLNRVLWEVLGGANLGWLALAVFVVAWIGQFIGHKIEGKKPSFLTDLVYLMIGPAWVLAKGYRKLGWSW